MDMEKSVTEEMEQTIRNFNTALMKNSLETVLMESAQAETSDWINEGPIIEAFHKRFQSYRIEEKSKILKDTRSDQIKQKIEIMGRATILAEVRTQAEKALKTVEETKASIDSQLFSASDSMNLKSNYNKEKGPELHC